VPATQTKRRLLDVDDSNEGLRELGGIVVGTGIARVDRDDQPTGSGLRRPAAYSMAGCDENALEVALERAVGVGLACRVSAERKLQVWCVR
jgi:hypothetical protein